MATAKKKAAAPKKKAIAVGCHPDDIEFMMAGTLIMLQKAGYEVHYMTVANGSLGTDKLSREQIVAMRRSECVAAAKLALKATKAIKVKQVKLVHQALRVTRVTRVIKATRVTKVTLVRTHS